MLKPGIVAARIDGKGFTPNFSQDDEKEDAKYIKIDLPASFQRIWNMFSFKTECISEPTPRQMNYGELAGRPIVGEFNGGHISSDRSVDRVGYIFGGMLQDALYCLPLLYIISPAF
jgi:hypothetical protein